MRSTSARSSPSSSASSLHRPRLAHPVGGAKRAARVDAVDDLAGRADRAVEAEVRRDELDDLLQRRRDDVDGLTAFAVPLDEPQRLGVDERAQHGLHRLADERLQLCDGKARQDHHPVLGRSPNTLGARAARDEQQLPERGLDEVEPRDDPARTKRRRKCENRRAADQRAIEVEERSAGARHETSGNVRVNPPVRAASRLRAISITA